MNFDDLAKKRIISSIEEDTQLKPSELDDIKSCVWILGKTYVQRDSEELEIVAVEREFSDNLCAGTVDLVGIIRNPVFLPKDSVGRKLIVDWKTSGKQALDTSWKKYYVDSWQWKIYSTFNDAQYFEYRGISKSSGDTKSILIKVPDLTTYLTKNYLLQLEETKVNLIEEGYAPWPQHMPYGCSAYGRDCQFLDDCKENFYPTTNIDDVPFHFTSSEVFMLCPEKYRRESLLEQKNGRDKVGTEETRFGSAVHRGMASIYQQIMEKQCEKK